MILGHHYIAGERHAAGTPLHSVDAITGERYPVSFYEATQAEVTTAAQAAQQAFRTFRTTSPSVRAALLEAIAYEIDALDASFIAEANRETALPVARLEGERKRTSNQLRMFAATVRRGDFLDVRIDRAQPERTPLPRPDLRQYRVAVGPVAVFGASNFPIAFSVAGGDTASALAAGCPVVVKAHPGHMVTSELVADAIVRAVAKSGLPAGIFNMVYGTAATGAALVKAPPIKAVGFTGSLAAGRALFDLAQARPEPIPVFAEMSSVNPVFLLPSALAERGAQIARELAASVTFGCGQLCTNPGLVLGVRSPAFDTFKTALRDALEQAAPQPMLGAGIRENFRRGVAGLRALPGVEELLAAGQDGRVGGHLFIADRDALLAGDALEEEVFGPSTILVELDDERDFVAFADKMQGQLTATVLANGTDLAQQAGLLAALETKVGRLLFNGYPTGVEVSDAIVHGGPYPATTDARGTSVGSAAIERFLRPVCYQNYPDASLPPALRDANPWKLPRLVDGIATSGFASVDNCMEAI
ncbi:Alpha-ketoglutaric semialdehyde dehydrogenase [Paraburkholderia piptadeniae]|uniref:Alpha-ketoglutaric semialdehyde dehydrogenase n=1 Tax=Paraburkholderia piptadeniae TaxID=1701573 RepID=A0A1N7SA29_9BURK|nr:aldehyde dehydrogenase (NADP(+)) [Paraburkholderia piptadeniae]SIT44181.1 Alpha-ketoglutaric semialdehyde dehydrogenase [Paraburkholderia piptadeniae]